MLAKIKAAVGQSKVPTWEVDKDGDYSHAPGSGQYVGKAWLRPLNPQPEDGALIFGIVGLKDKGVSREVAAVMKGRFIAMLLSHFHDSFTHAAASASLDSRDVARQYSD